MMASHFTKRKHANDEAWIKPGFVDRTGDVTHTNRFNDKSTICSMRYRSSNEPKSRATHFGTEGS